MKKWAWPLALTALSLASAPAFAVNQWVLSETGWWDSGTASCTYKKEKPGKTQIIVKGNSVAWGNTYSACVKAHQKKNNRPYLISVPGAIFNRAEAAED